MRYLFQLDDRSTMAAQHWIRLTGIAGILGAIGWMFGDMALVGNYLPEGPQGPLFDAYSASINTTLATVTVQSSMSRLATGALLGPLTIPLYLVGCWHLLLGVKPAGKWFAIPSIALLFIGHAYSPLGHAGFYYVAAVYKTILATDVTAHPALLDLAAHFSTVLMTMYIAAVGSLVLGLLWLIVAMASGRSAWPRWMAIATLASVVVALSLDHLPLPQPVRALLAGAGINIAWFLIFVLSTAVLWNPRQPAGAALSRHI
jgi:hypothetical protein